MIVAIAAVFNCVCYLIIGVWLLLWLLCWLLRLVVWFGCLGCYVLLNLGDCSLVVGLCAWWLFAVLDVWFVWVDSVGCR